MAESNVDEKNNEYSFSLPKGYLLNNRYKIGEVIGQGGFGITYKAFDTVFETVVAIKEYYPSGLVARSNNTEVSIITTNHENEFEHGLKRFLREARDVKKFANNPNIVSVQDFFTGNGTAYMVMEFLEGESLRDYMKRIGGKIDEDMAIQVIFSLMRTLEEVHATGIVHRDIASDNVFICKDKNIKLIDFGAAREATGADQKSASIVLKQGYAPVEQYSRKGNIGPWTDVYAFGALVYIMMTGKRPEASVDRVLDDELIPPRELNPNISENMNRVIMKALSVKAEDRYQNMGEMKAALLAEEDEKDESDKKENEINGKEKFTYEERLRLEEKRAEQVNDKAEPDIFSKEDIIPDHINELKEKEPVIKPYTPASPLEKGKDFIGDHLAAFIIAIGIIALLLVVIAAGDFGKSKKKDSKSASSNISQGKEGDSLRVENGVFLIDETLFGKSYQEIKKVFPDIPAAEAWNYGKTGYQETFLDYYIGSAKYTLFFQNDSLFSVVYETEGESVDPFYQSMKSEYGEYNKKYQYVDGTIYWYDWNLSGNILLSCYRNRYNGTHYICQEYSTIAYGSRSFIPKNSNPRVTGFSVYSSKTENPTIGNSVNEVPYGNKHYWYFKVEDIGYLDPVQFTYKTTVTSSGFAVESEGEVIGNVKDGGIIEIEVDVKDSVEKANGGPYVGTLQELVEVYIVDSKGNKITLSSELIGIN